MKLILLIERFKDFLSPNKLGWNTICLLDNGNNIHKQAFDLEKNKLPNYCINNFLEFGTIISKISSSSV